MPAAYAVCVDLQLVPNRHVRWGVTVSPTIDVRALWSAALSFQQRLVKIN